MYRRYLAVLLGLCGVFLAYALHIALTFEPLTGDLTRVGGYTEKDYGWNGVEERFVPPLAEPGSLDGAYPIIVVGDSYSMQNTPDRQTPYGSFWTDYLAAGTGLGVGVFDVRVNSLARVLDSAAYRAGPRLVILELSERTLRKRLAGGADCHEPAPWIAPTLAPSATPPRPQSFRRALSSPSVETMVDQIADLLRKRALRLLIGERVTMARQLPLTRDDLFTSSQPAKLLAYAGDLLKAGWTDADWKTFRCRLLSDQREVMANGKTSFVFVLAPDKSSAYAPWLPPGAWQVDAAPRMAEAAGLRMPRVDTALRAAIAAGTRDVYLPDDTHWSTAGARIVARTVIEYLRAEPPPPASSEAGVSASR